MSGRGAFDRSCPVLTAFNSGRRLSGAGCAAVLLDVWFVWHRETAERLISSEPHIAAVALLPLVEIRSAKQENYFADGLAEELITEVGRLSSVRVISRISALSLLRRKERADLTPGGRTATQCRCSCRGDSKTLKGWVYGSLPGCAAFKR
jgi:hypothetical protein